MNKLERTIKDAIEERKSTLYHVKDKNLLPVKYMSYSQLGFKVSTRELAEVATTFDLLLHLQHNNSVAGLLMT